MLALLDWSTKAGEGTIVPEPSGESTFTAGEEASETSDPVASILLFASHVCCPGVVGAVAPGPLLALARR